MRVSGLNTVPYMMIQSGFSPPLAGGWTTAKSSFESGMIEGSATTPTAASVTTSHATPATAPPPAVTTVSAATPTQHPPVAPIAPMSAAAIAATRAYFPPLIVSTAQFLLPGPPTQLFCPRGIVSVLNAGFVAEIFYAASPVFVEVIEPSSNHLICATYPDWL